MNKQFVQLDTPASKFYTYAEQLFSNLAMRWMDEKDYEDINDYGKVIEKEMEKFNKLHDLKHQGLRIVKMIKQPFGCFFTQGEKEYKITCGRSYIYQRTK